MCDMPLHEGLQMYSECCGKTFCGGCNYQHQLTSGERPACAFCREPISGSNEELLARARKRVERKDPKAALNIALEHGYGGHGLPVNQAKCIDLLRECAGLGYPVAHYQLGNFHHNGEMGLEQNEEVGLKYWEKGAEGGHLMSRYNAGCKEYDNGDHVAAMRHLRLSASGGMRKSMDCLIECCFESGLLHHGDLAESLQAMYRARAELRSEDRNTYIEHLKRTGEYEEAFGV